MGRMAFTKDDLVTSPTTRRRTMRSEISSGLPTFTSDSQSNYQKLRFRFRPWAYSLETIFLRGGISFLSVAGIVGYLTLHPSSTMMAPLVGLSSPTLPVTSKPQLIYPETSWDDHPYDSNFTSLRSQIQYHRLTLHPPSPRKLEEKNSDKEERIPWKSPYESDLEDLKMEQSDQRGIRYGSYEEMISAAESPNDDDWLAEVSDKDYKYYYTFDDDFERGRRVAFNGINPDPEAYGTPSLCRRTALHRLMFPTCNEIHQLDYAAGNTYNSEFEFINDGTFRDVFGIFVEKQKPVAIKEIRYEKVGVDHEMYEYVRMDALVAERLANVPQTYDLYGYCALTLITEFFFHGDVEKQALWKSDSRDSGKGNKIEPDQLLTPEQKLVISFEMAKGLAHLHGHADGMLIHGDVQMSQFLLNREKTVLKLNDFNRAEVMLWDETHNEYCRHRNGVGHGSWRSPEEYRNDGLTDRVDVWSLCNNMLTILTGEEPDVPIERGQDEKWQKAFTRSIMAGKIGYIDPKYDDATTSSNPEFHLAKMIRKCFSYNPVDRPSIFEVVQELELAVEEAEKEKGETRIQFLQSIKG